MRLVSIAIGALACVIAGPNAPASAADRPSAPATPRDPSPMVGLYAVPASACSIAAQAGFTVVQPEGLIAADKESILVWIASARAYLDTAQRHGLRVLLDLPPQWTREHHTQAVRDAIRALRDHPALCAWFEGGVVPAREVGAIEFLQRIVGDEDPAHGLVLDATTLGEQAIGYGRARAYAYQPVTRDSRRSSRLQPAAEQIPSEAARVPFWVVLQAFGVDVVRGPAKSDLVMPTRNEMEASLASAMVTGARAIFFSPYMHPSVYGDHASPEGKRGYGDSRPLPELAPEAWSSVVSTTRLASRLLQATAGADRSAALRVARAPRGVEVGRWDTAAGIVVVIGNLGRRAAAIELACDEEPAGIEWMTQPEHAIERDGRRLELLIPPTSGAAFLIRSTASMNVRRP